MMGVFAVNYRLLSYVLKIPKETIDILKAEVLKLSDLTNYEKQELRLELTAITRFDELDLSAIPVETVAKINEFIDNFQLFGIDLSRTPDTKMGWDMLWLIPILTGVTSLAMGVYTWLRQKQTNPEMAKNPSSGCMTLMSPAMSIYFSFLFPASVGIYIIMSSALSFIQMIITNKVLTPKKMLAKAMVEETINRRAKEKVLKSVAEKKNED
jgi:YidC/Oxa1 family membrane protein insertase